MPIQKTTLKRLGLALGVLAVIGAGAAFFMLRRSPAPVPAAPAPRPPTPKAAKPAAPAPAVAASSAAAPGKAQAPAVVSTAPAPGRVESGPAPRGRIPEPAAKEDLSPEEAAKAKEILASCSNEISLLCDGNASPKAQLDCLAEHRDGLMSACSQQLKKR